VLTPPQTATQLLPVRAFTCSVLVSTLFVVVIDAAFEFDADAVEEFERPFVDLLLFVLFAVPAFMIKLLTAACATDLKSASVGGFDRTLDVGAVVEADDVDTTELFFFARAVVAD